MQNSTAQENKRELLKQIYRCWEEELTEKSRKTKTTREEMTLLMKKNIQTRKKKNQDLQTALINACLPICKYKDWFKIYYVQKSFSLHRVSSLLAWTNFSGPSSAFLSKTRFISCSVVVLCKFISNMNFLLNFYFPCKV